MIVYFQHTVFMKVVFRIYGKALSKMPCCFQLSISLFLPLFHLLLLFFWFSFFVPSQTSSFLYSPTSPSCLPFLTLIVFQRNKENTFLPSRLPPFPSFCGRQWGNVTCLLFLLFVFVLGRLKRVKCLIILLRIRENIWVWKGLISLNFRFQSWESPGWCWEKNVFPYKMWKTCIIFSSI